MSATKVRFKMEPAQAIIVSYGLQQGGAASLYFAQRARHHMDTYVPMDTGNLKNDVTVSPGKIRYNAPYATRQYFENAGRGNRGRHWDERMWADRGEQLTRELARFVGIE